jgi:hypothetical protein
MAIKNNKAMEVEYMKLLEREIAIHREGIIEGEKRGKIEFSKLIIILLEEGKIEELKRAAQDEDYREELLRRYNIITHKKSL